MTVSANISARMCEEAPKAAFAKIAAYFPDMLERTVLHEPGDDVDQTVDAISDQVKFFYDNNPKIKRQAPRREAYTVYLERALNEMDPRSHWCQPVSFILSEFVERDRPERLRKVFGRHFDRQDANRLWPDFTLFQHSFLIGLAQSWNLHAAMPKHSDKFHAAMVGRADVFGLLVLAQQTNRSISDFAIELASSAKREKEEHFRTSSVAINVAQLARTKEGREVIETYNYAELYNFADRLCNKLSLPVPDGPNFLFPKPAPKNG